MTNEAFQDYQERIARDMQLVQDHLDSTISTFEELLQAQEQLSGEFLESYK